MEEIRKIEQLRSKYERLKKRIRDWEHAIYKTEGRKPDKDDMKSAPGFVQEAYRDLVKIRKYLEAHQSSSTSRKAEKALTPGKIFMGKNRRQLSPSDRVYFTRTPGRSTQKPKKQAPSLGLRSTSSSAAPAPSTSQEKEAASAFPFKKLFGNLSAASKLQLVEGKKHSTVLVKEDSNETVSRTVLIANRTLKNPEETSSSSTKVNKPFSIDDDIVADVGKGLPPFRAKTATPEKKVEKDFLKSPRVKGRQSLRTSKALDTGWLARINEAEKTLPEETSDSFQNDENITPGKNPEPSVSFGSDSAMDVECVAEPKVVLPGTLPPQFPENSDSGISFMNSHELSKTMDEVLQETSQNNTSVMSDADGSMLYSFSEDACLPSDPEQDDFPTVNNHTISNLLKSLSDSINNDDEASKSTLCSSGSQASKDSDERGKRSFSYAFSPSPEKPQKRKFFKSSKGERTSRAVYAVNSFAPGAKKKSPIIESPSAVTLTKKNVRTTARSKAALTTSSPPGPVAVKASSAPKKKTLRAVKKINYDETDETNSEPVAPAPSANKHYAADIFDEVSQPTIKITKGRGRRNYKVQTIDAKMSAGKVEDNYVRIDTTKKVFVRGHRKISAVKLKRLDFKQRKSFQGKQFGLSNFTCNKCGEKGHFAKFCTKGQDSAALEEAPGEQDDSPFPTLEEAARMVYKNPVAASRVANFTSNATESQETPSEVPESSMETDADADDPFSEPMPEVEMPKIVEIVDPFFDYEENSDPTIITDNENEIMLEAVKSFGYDSFRSGQKEAIHRVLKGLSTLLILSTGSGKSLCYQLPAYLYQKKYPGALTLCISPLVSLMEDQVQGIPPFLNAACLHGGMTTKQKDIVLEKVRSKSLHILLVSPEAVCGGMFGLLKGNTSDFPKISFACIDEVHCVSQWSHNFRPSYLQLCKILREKLNVSTILGLTATATETTARSICEHLQVDPSTAIRGELIPRNLKLSVSRDVYKDEALLNLLNGDRFKDCDSIIIYCTRREECERIATLVRTKMQDVATHKIVKTKKGARLSGTCEAYHAGMTARKRKNVQTGFMSGEIRIVVATVAFGMGIDKSDIRAVIHYNMPSAFESYVQEIGRAGRDGLPAHCHLFLDNSRRNDLCELKRHVYGNSVDRPTIRNLLRKIFLPCRCKRIASLKGNTDSTSDAPCPGHEVSFSIDNTVQDLDLPKENITTLLCYLELGEKKWIDILPLTYETCRIQSYGGAKLFKTAAAKCPPLAVAIALLKEKNKFRETDTFLEFNVIEAAAAVGWKSSIVKSELKNLQWAATAFDEKGNGTKFRKSALLVEFSGLAYRVKAPGSLTDEEADEVLNSLHGRNQRQEQTELYQLDRVYQALLSVSCANVNNLCDSYDEEKSSQLKKFIYDYFTESSEHVEMAPEPPLDPGKEEALRRSIRQLIDSNRDINFTTRSIAKIFQGISSPCFPADVWYRNKDFWRRYLDVDFHVICRIAAEEL